jgi:hypothetical protein
MAKRGGRRPDSRSLRLENRGRTNSGRASSSIELHDLPRGFYFANSFRSIASAMIL